MAEFQKAYLETIGDEGGFTLHNVSGDAGGDTFAGIAKNYHPEWSGWALVHAGKGQTEECREQVRAFYKSKYWDAMRGDEIEHQAVAETIYNFGMNSSIKKSLMYAQYCLDCEPDGEIGPITLGAINKMSREEIELFVSQHALMRIGHRLKRISQNRSQLKFIRGWLKRDLRMLDDFINVNQYFGIRQ
ncbi:glycosyl hydrolase 108 family protein [Prosthecochloris sp.]|uniref:glycosyl hydrolase 108 family protein n=1 Tax=Prosthecochloris sp. TaxID=290513 RepID=UPI00257E8446|nr:glycosyl hydrolase 108 family protein [Prosthecochloris sp.]